MSAETVISTTNTIDTITVLNIIISLIGVIISAIAAYYTYKNLKEIRLQFFEQNRGNLVFYITQQSQNVLHTLVIKNFGNSPAKLLSLEIEPKLDWSKTKNFIPEHIDISNCQNVFLAQGQFISSEFDFRDYPDKEFSINISYETCGKTYSESYVIDINYNKFLLSAGSGSIKDIPQGLKAINKSIQQLSDRFL